MMKSKRFIHHIIISLAFGMIVSSCATMRIDPSNQSEQVTVTFDKTIKSKIDTETLLFRDKSDNVYPGLALLLSLGIHPNTILLHGGNLLFDCRAYE